MNSEYGGEQREMLLKKTNQEVDYLGPYEKIVEVGDDQNMLLKQGGDVPFQITPQQSVDTQFSHYYELQIIDNTKAELLGNIKSSTVDISVVKGKWVGYMQDISHDRKYISVQIILRKERVKGYMVKPKGLLQ